MVAVVQERDVVRPVLLREVLEALHLIARGSVEEDAEASGQHDGVVYLHVLYVGLPDKDQVSPLLRPEVALHRSEEHTSELQSRQYLVCRLLLEKKISSLISLIL